MSAVPLDFVAENVLKNVFSFFYSAIAIAKGSLTSRVIQRLLSVFENAASHFCLKSVILLTYPAPNAIIFTIIKLSCAYVRTCGAINETKT